MKFLSIFLKVNFLAILLSSSCLFGSAKSTQSGSSIKKLMTVLCTAAVLAFPHAAAIEQQKPVNQRKLTTQYVSFPGMSIPMTFDPEEVLNNPAGFINQALAERNYFLSLIEAAQKAEQEEEEKNSKSK